MAAGYAVRYSLHCRLASLDDCGVVVESVQRRHTAAETVPQVLSRQHAETIVHILCADRTVGYRRAFHTPLVAEYACHKTAVRARPDYAYAIERTHNAESASANRALETFEIDFAYRLFVAPRAYSVTSLFLVVECKMLRENIYALALNSRDFGCADFSRQPAVFAVILEVSSRIRRAVYVCARSVYAGINFAVVDIARVNEVFGYALAHFGYEFEIVRCRHNVLRCVTHRAFSADKSSGESLRSVFVQRAGESYFLTRLRHMETVVNNVCHFRISQLFYQRIPPVVVCRNLAEVGDFQSRVFIHSRNFRDIGIVEFFILLGYRRSSALVVCQSVFPHLVRYRQLYRLLRECSRPILSCQIRYLLSARSLVLIQVRFFEQVAYLLSRSFRHRICFRVYLRFVPLLCKRRISLAAHLAFVHGYPVGFLRHQNIVYGVMRIRCRREVIVPLAHYVRLCLFMVVARQVFFLHRYRIRFRSAFLYLFLVESAYLNRGLLHVVFLFVPTVRRLEVYLHSMFCRYVSRVLYLDAHFETIVFFRDVEIRILEIHIRHSASERVCHHRVIVELSRISLPKHVIFVSCLVVSISHVYSLLVYYVVAVGFVYTAVVIVLRGFEFQFVCICIIERAEILHRRRRVVVFQKRVYYSARRNDVSAQYIRHGGHTRRADVSRPQNGVYIVFIHKVNLHYVRHIKQNHDVFERAGFFHSFEILQKLDFFLAKAQIVSVRHIRFQRFQAARQVCSLSAASRKHDQRHVSVVLERVFQRLSVF